MTLIRAVAVKLLILNLLAGSSALAAPTYPLEVLKGQEQSLVKTLDSLQNRLTESTLSALGRKPSVLLGATKSTLSTMAGCASLLVQHPVQTLLSIPIAIVHGGRTAIRFSSAAAYGAFMSAAEFFGGGKEAKETSLDQLVTLKLPLSKHRLLMAVRDLETTLPLLHASNGERAERVWISRAGATLETASGQTDIVPQLYFRARIQMQLNLENAEAAEAVWNAFVDELFAERHVFTIYVDMVRDDSALISSI